MTSNLLTNDPIALQALMSETLFDVPDKGIVYTEKIEVIENISSPVMAEQSPLEEFIYQGNKDKGILFILRYEAYPYFSPKAEDAFQKIMEAMQLNVKEVAVVNLANTHNPNDFKRIMTYFTPTKIILLGVEPLSLKLPEIAHNSYMKGKIATVFNTFSFEEMFNDMEKKRAFWGEFKSFIQS